MSKIVWNKNMYIGENAKRAKRRIMSCIRNRKPYYDVYIIALSDNKHDIFDIYSSYVLMQPYFLNKDLEIVGIARGIDEAYEIIGNIAIDCYKSYNHYKLKKLFGKEED